MIRILVIVFGVLFMGIGGWVLVQPHGLTQFADVFLNPQGFRIAIGLRLVIGVLLLLTAAASRYPTVLRILAALFLLSAVALPIIGLERMQSIGDWGVNLDPAVLRGIGLAAFALGAFIVYAVSARGSER